jgi:hypothetical protein
LRSLHKIPVVLVYCFLFSTTTYGGDPWRLSAGAGEAGTGYVCVMKSSFWSSFHNQASLAFQPSFSAGFNYESRFAVKELGTRTAGIVIPSGKASFGAVYSYFGYPDFKREMAGISCGLKLSEKLAAGVQADYFGEKTYGEYANTGILTCEAGLIWLPSEDVRIGVHVFNPLPASLNKAGLPLRVRTGAGISLGKNLFAGTEAEMSSGYKMLLRAGFDYEAMKKLWLHAGFSTEGNAFSFGLGYALKFMQVDVSFATHEKLGITPSV